VRKPLRNHPLLMIGQSNQPKLIKHKAVRKLLDLKWRYFPRFFFYMNLFLYILFLVSYSMNSRTLTGEHTNSCWLNMSFFLLALFSGYEVIQLVTHLLIDLKPSYSVSFKNIAEFFNFMFCFISLSIPNRHPSLKSSLYSVTVLLVYLVFMLRLDKIPHIGVYVVVFKKVLKKSLTVLPLVIILITGFLVAFTIRANFDHQSGIFYNHTNGTNESENKIEKFNASLSNSVFFLIQMMLADFDVENLGLNDRITLANSANYVILFLFVLLMTVFLYNLFIGIAVAEISSIMVDAELEYIKFKIEYVLRFQSFLDLFGKAEWMVFEKYDRTNENRLILFYKRCKSLIFSFFHRTDPKYSVQNQNIQFQSFESIEADLKILKQDIHFLKTALLSNDRNEVVSQILEQNQAIREDNGILNSKLSTIGEDFVILKSKLSTIADKLSINEHE
jgi:hypothetical protein